MRAVLLFLLISLMAIKTSAGSQLSSGAQEWIENYQSTRQPTSQAYLYLNGMDAPEDANVLTHGKRKLAIYQQAEEDYFNNAEPSQSKNQALASLQRLKQPGPELSCFREKFSCYRSIIKNSANLSAASYPHSIWLERYQNFLKLRDYQTLTRPHRVEVIPSFANLSNANFLLLHKIIDWQQSGQCDKATKALRLDLTAMRYHFKNSDHLIQKMFFASMISGDIEMLGFLQQAGCAQSTIKPLSGEELTMQLVMQREFIFGINSIEVLFGISSLQTTNAGQTVERNDGIDYLFSTLKPVAEFIKVSDNQPLADYAATSKKLDTVLAKATETEKEYFGDDPGAYLEYALRLYEANAKVALLNSLIYENIDSAVHPYINSAEVVYDSDIKAWCFDESLAQRKFNQCIGNYVL